MVLFLERGADLHMAQLMPLPLTVSCFSKIQFGFAFLVPAHPGSPGKRAVKRVCVCVFKLKICPWKSPKSGFHSKSIIPLLNSNISRIIRCNSDCKPFSTQQAVKSGSVMLDWPQKGISLSNPVTATTVSLHNISSVVSVYLVATCMVTHFEPLSPSTNKTICINICIP